MDTLTINRVLLKNRATKRHYVGCFPSDRIPRCRRFPCSMVVNLDGATEPGSHWVAIFAPHPQHVYYFDSYGLPADGEILKYLRTFRHITRQKMTIQSVISDVCGYYALFFVFMCSLRVPYHKINRILADVPNPDLFVVKFCRAIL